ncbi:nucleoside phosphorylase [Tundrisphaera sp. TA3]|uniref:phosphorylase family protein n=1 Tax=Tundrisphaera sp. TA3 TaxID=3435775 RepID=UPI003EBC40C6
MVMGPGGKPARPPGPADIGIVAALSIEIAPLISRLRDVRKYAGERLTVIEGELGDQLIAVVVAGAGRKRAQIGAEILIDGHRPRWIISAGFGGALSPDLHRGDIVLADEVMNLEGGRFAIDVAVPPPVPGQPAIRAGRLLTVDEIIRTAAEKAELHARTGASVVDMETSSVAALCGERGVRFLSVRVISDEAGVDLPPEVVAILGRSGGLRLGAAVGAIWKRPSSMKDLLLLRDHARSAADRLSAFLSATMGQLT